MPEKYPIFRFEIYEIYARFTVDINVSEMYRRYSQDIPKIYL